MEQSDNDSELVRRARLGDADAFARLVKRHYDACLRYACRMVGDRADAQDLVQETFVRAYRALHRYKDRKRFQPWLFRILANRCRTFTSRRAWRKRLLLGYSQQANGRAHTEPAAPANLFRRDLQRLLDRLSPALREAFLLKHVEEMSYEEIAQVTGASEPALKMRVKRACDALECMLKDTSDV